MDGLRLAVGTLTAVPVRVRRIDRATAGRAMLYAPAVGAGLGAGAGCLGALVGLLGGGSLLAAVVALAGMAVLTRGLHLDGLADTADALGSGSAPAAALRIMKASAIGPFGVVALVLVVLAQAAALAEARGAWYRGIAVLVTAGTAGRLAVTWACRRGIPAARDEGLGALVAQTVRPGALTAATVVTLAAAAGLGWLTAGGLGLVRAVVAVVAGLLGAALLLRHAVARFGGITGDVLGALVETATVVALVVLALG